MARCRRLAARRCEGVGWRSVSPGRTCRSPLHPARGEEHLQRLAFAWDLAVHDPDDELVRPHRDLLLAAVAMPPVPGLEQVVGEPHAGRATRDRLHFALVADVFEGPPG